MAEITIHNHTFSSEKPTICVPITAVDRERVLEQARVYAAHQVEMVEWRADLYNNLYDTQDVLETLKMVSKLLPDCVLLFTVRSKAQGGNSLMTGENLRKLLVAVAQTEETDVIDVECDSWPNPYVVIEELHKNNVKVIGSFHDFVRTPSVEEMGEIFGRLTASGVDIVKLAVMPQSPSDVANLLLATSSYTDHHDKTPVISMSMGRLGAISRVGCYTFGSCVTFAALGETSAPGQLGYDAMKNILESM